MGVGVSAPAEAFESLSARFRARPRLRRLDEVEPDQGGVSGRYLVISDDATYVTRPSYPTSGESATVWTCDRGGRNSD